MSVFIRCLLPFFAPAQTPVFSRYLDTKKTPNRTKTTTKRGVRTGNFQKLQLSTDKPPPGLWLRSGLSGSWSGALTDDGSAWAAERFGSSRRYVHRQRNSPGTTCCSSYLSASSFVSLFCWRLYLRDLQLSSSTSCVCRFQMRRGPVRPSGSPADPSLWWLTWSSERCLERWAVQVTSRPSTWLKGDEGVEWGLQNSSVTG